MKAAKSGAKGASQRQASAKSTTPASQDAEELLKADHRKVEALFEKFEAAQNGEKANIVAEVCRELLAHAEVEEEIFYPACREKNVEASDMDEAQVEHDGAKILISDLMRGRPEDEFFDAKVTVLKEYVKHHVGEEEKEIFKKARKAGVDMAELGRKIAERKAELMQETDGPRPSPPVSIDVGGLVEYTSQQERSMSNYEHRSGSRSRDDDDYRGGRGRDRDERGGGRMPERDDRGRFMSDDDDERGGRRSGGGGGGGGGGGRDAGYRSRMPDRDDRGRFMSDDDDDRRGGSSRRSGGEGRRSGGWVGDPEGHSEASRRGWQNSDHEGSGWYGDSEGHSEASRRGWQHSDHEGSGWYGDPEGHSEASRRGWEHRGGGRSSSYREDERGGGSRRGGGEGRGRGGGGGSGWHGDPQGHSEASRQGWRNRE